MTRAYIHLPPVEVEAGQTNCPRRCPQLQSAYDSHDGVCEFAFCAAWHVNLEHGWDDILRCPACLAAERRKVEP